MNLEEELGRILSYYQDEIYDGNFDKTIKKIFKAFEKHNYRKVEMIDGYWSQ